MAATATFDVAGNKLADDTANHYVGTNESYVQVVDGGTVIGSGEADIMWKDKGYVLGTDGRIVTGEGSPTYDTFYIVADSENISDIAKNPTTAIEVSAGALVIDAATTGIDITVTGEGTITGEKADAKQVKIATDATAYYTGVVADSGVVFTPGGELLEDTVAITNDGEAATYSISNRDMAVAAQSLEMTGEENVTVSNYVVVDELVNTTGKVLTLDNQDALVLHDMSITDSTVQVYTDVTHETEGVVLIAGILQGGDATLKADLTLVGGSTLDVDGGDTRALTLGSKLTVDYASGLINLDDDTLLALNDMNIGDTLNLIVAADQTSLLYGGESSYDGMWYDQMFNRSGIQGVSLLGDYQVYAQGDAFGLKKVSNVPEPTTGTLSLLALAALAARRRRK